MLTAKELLGRAQALEPQLVEWRRTLHRHPEVGFDLTQTKALVKKALTEMGYEPKDCGKPGGGSVDFAFVSHEVPTVSMFLTAGNANEGYTYGQHHPKVKFDDSVLFEGSAAYAYMALRWLQEHK